MNPGIKTPTKSALSALVKRSDPFEHLNSGILILSELRCTEIDLGQKTPWNCFYWWWINAGGPCRSWLTRQIPPRGYLRQNPAASAADIRKKNI